MWGNKASGYFLKSLFSWPLKWYGSLWQHLTAQFRANDRRKKLPFFQNQDRTKRWIQNLKRPEKYAKHLQPSEASNWQLRFDPFHCLDFNNPYPDFLSPHFITLQKSIYLADRRNRNLRGGHSVFYTWFLDLRPTSIWKSLGSDNDAVTFEPIWTKRIRNNCTEGIWVKIWLKVGGQEGER